MPGMLATARAMATTAEAKRGIWFREMPCLRVVVVRESASSLLPLATTSDMFSTAQRWAHASAKRLGKLMDSEQWISAWGKDRLTNGSDGIIVLPAAAAEFIRSYGLPSRVIFEGAEGTLCARMAFEISFEPLTHPLLRTARLSVGVISATRIFERSWSEQLVIGKKRNSAMARHPIASKAKPAPSPRIDAESETPESLVNSGGGTVRPLAFTGHTVVRGEFEDQSGELANVQCGFRRHP